MYITIGSAFQRHYHYLFPSFPSFLPSFRLWHGLLLQPLGLGTWCEVFLSMYITYIPVSKSTPLAVTGPHGQLASNQNCVDCSSNDYRKCYPRTYSPGLVRHQGQFPQDYPGFPCPFKKSPNGTCSFNVLSFLKNSHSCILDSFSVNGISSVHLNFNSRSNVFWKAYSTLFCEICCI